MKKLTHSMLAKTIAIFFLTITMVTLAAGTVGTIFLFKNKFYSDSGSSFRQERIDVIVEERAKAVFYGYIDEELYKISKNENILFKIKDNDGNVVLSNYYDRKFEFESSYKFTDTSDVFFNESTKKLENIKDYTVQCYVKELNLENQYVKWNRFIDIANKVRYIIIIATIASFVLGFVLFVFLMLSAGRRKGKEEIVSNFIDKIPLDIYLAALIAIGCVEAGLSLSIVIVLLFIIDSLLVIQFCMSLATRYKQGNIFKNTIIYRSLKYIKKGISFIVYLLKRISLFWKTILAICIISVVEFIAIVICCHSIEILLILWAIEKLLLCAVVAFAIINLKELQKGGEKIASGDLNYKIDTSKMFYDFKNHGENLNNINAGISVAVEEQMKSERFKTELITNVSHDIKTPLTSIINYVDLLKKEEINEDPTKKYIEVLDRQSARLKKLIEDLIEASKASTGNLQVDMRPTELGVLLTQISGEYEEKAREEGLDLIIQKADKELYIMADGKLLWRVFDNLMSNICKYAQKDTRVYLNCEIKNQKALIIFKNVSRFQLNITSDELLERFIRGDRSRSTDGSGLGLSIAKNLTELQNGLFDLQIDGDLFKVILSFNI